MSNNNSSSKLTDRRTVLKGIGAAGLGTTVFGDVAIATPGKNDDQGCDRLVNPNSNSPQHYDTIQDAVDDSTSGDTICVVPGTYDEQVVIETDGLTFRGSGCPKNVVVNAGAGKRETFDVNDASGVTIDRFTVRNTGGSGASKESYGIRVTGKSDNITLRNSIVKDISEEARGVGFTVDLDFGSGGGGVPGGVQGVEVTNCRFENIYTTKFSEDLPNFRFTKAKGIALNGDVRGAEISHTTIRNIGDTGSGRNSDFGRGITLTEDDNDVGPTDFEIRRCEFSNMDGRFGNPFDGAAVFVGEYPDFGDHTVEDNNILIAVENFPNGNPPQSGNDVLSAPNNYWGASNGPNVTEGGGGDGSNVTKNVEFDPFRDEPVDDAGDEVCEDDDEEEEEEEEEE